MSNTYSLRCRWDQTFRFPRDFSAYDTIIQAGAVARMEMTFANGFVLEFSSNSGDGKDGTFVYDIDKNGWFICSIDKLAALYASFGGSSKALSATWAARLEKDGASQVVMSGRAIWAAPDISETADSSSNGTGTGTFGQTVLVEGEDDTTPRVLIPPYSTGSVNWSDILNRPAFGTASLLAASALLLVANNLSDLANKPTARTNLGLGSIATISAPGGTSTFLRADGTWASAGASGGSDGQIQYNSATTLAGSPLWRESANAIAQRNGVTAQASFLYNTFTDVSNYERGVFDWSTTANTLRIGTSKLGTGSARPLQFVIGDTNIAQFNASGHLLWNTDNTYDIGASGTGRPRNMYIAGAFTSGGNVATSLSIIAGVGTPLGSSFLGLNGSATISSVSASGNIALANWAGTSFGLLQLGGTTSSFPAIKRSWAALAFRLADDSADAAITASSITLSGNIGLTGASTQVMVPSNGYFLWNGRAVFSSPADGAIQLSNASVTLSATLAIDANHVLAQRNSTNAQTFRVYNTYTDASNYEHAIFDWQGSANVLTIGTGNLGTGSARNMRFVIGGVSKLDYGISTPGLWTVGAALRTSVGFTAAASIAVTAGGSIGMWNGAPFGWTSGGAVNETGITLDTRFSRVAAGIVKIDNGSTGAGCVVTQAVAFASLPSATTAGDGARAFINDCNVTASGNFGAAAAGGGANKVPVYAQGGTWYIG